MMESHIYFSLASDKKASCVGGDSTQSFKPSLVFKSQVGWVSFLCIVTNSCCSSGSVTPSLVPSEGLRLCKYPRYRRAGTVEYGCATLGARTAGSVLSNTAGASHNAAVCPPPTHSRIKKV